MESSRTLDDCLNLISGERDEQKVAGLLLVTKFFQPDDNALVLKVYEAVGTQFLERLLATGLGTGPAKSMGWKSRSAYLRLSVTLLAAFCRVPEIASSEDMISKIHRVVQALSIPSNSTTEEIYETLLLVATTSEDGFAKVYESGVITAIASHISKLRDGSKSMEMVLKLMQLILGRVPAKMFVIQYKSEMPELLPIIAKQFAILHSSLKFDALHVLAAILSVGYIKMGPYGSTLYDKVWPTHVLMGVLDVLQNRVASTEKLCALSLADSMMSIYGEKWLLNQDPRPDNPKPLSVGMGLLLVLETTRVEVAVFLNELASLKYGDQKSSSSAKNILSTQMNVAILFSLLEKIIKLVSENQGTEVDEESLVKVILGLNETTDVVLDFLQDARDHGHRKGDDLLAAVRIIGSYLAEAPSAGQEKVEPMMTYLLSVEGGDEPRPYSSIRFMLPMLWQWTLDDEGCNALAALGVPKMVVEFLAKAVTDREVAISRLDSDVGGLFLACKTVRQILLNRESIRPPLDGSHFLALLRAMASWAGDGESCYYVLVASSICSLVLDLISEETLLAQCPVDSLSLQRFSRMFAGSLTPSEELQGSLLELQAIVSSAYLRWGDRYPTLRRLVEERRSQAVPTVQRANWP